jgi:hypothetical protein
MAKLRFSLALVGAFFLVLVSAVFGASPRIIHAAETTDPPCTVSFSLQLNPGVTTSPQNIAATGQVVNSNCTPLGGPSKEHGTRTVGNLTGNASNATCSSLDIIGNDSVTDRNKTVSRYSWELKFNQLAVGSSFTATVRITSGPHAGTTVSTTPQVATLQGDCTSGVTQITSNAAAATFSH